MASSSVNWSDIKDQKQHKLALAKGLRLLAAPDDPFNIDTSFFHQLAKFPHQHAKPFEAGVTGRDERELKGYQQYLSKYDPSSKDNDATKESVKFCTKYRCTYTLVKNGLETLERGYRMQACIAARYHHSHSPAECKTMKNYLLDNPIDLSLIHI